MNPLPTNLAPAIGNQLEAERCDIARQSAELAARERELIEAGKQYESLLKLRDDHRAELAKTVRAGETLQERIEKLLDGCSWQQGVVRLEPYAEVAALREALSHFPELKARRAAAIPPLDARIAELETEHGFNPPK